MITIHEKVRDILYSDEEALSAFSRGFINLSAYAKQIRKRVEEETKKEVTSASIVVALSRIQKEIGVVHPLLQNVVLNNITSKSPLVEIVFDKNMSILGNLSSLFKKVQTSGDDFLTMTLGTSEITVICSDRLKEKVIEHLGEKPTFLQSGLASLGLSLDPKYYELPNITFSLLRKIAQKRIVLAETITTHKEIIFVFSQKSLPEMTALFHASAQAYTTGTV
jgi:hypothetical protein